MKLTEKGSRFSTSIYRLSCVKVVSWTKGVEVGAGMNDMVSMRGRLRKDRGREGPGCQRNNDKIKRGSECRTKERQGNRRGERWRRGDGCTTKKDREKKKRVKLVIPCSFDKGR